MTRHANNLPAIHPANNLPAIHPGEFLQDELVAMNANSTKFAAHIQVPHHEILEIMNGTRDVTARMAIRLGKGFGTTPEYWLNMQIAHDLKKAKAEDVPEIEQLHGVKIGEPRV
jgi:addiction module HigA family antidote